MNQNVCIGPQAALTRLGHRCHYHIRSKERRSISTIHRRGYAGLAAAAAAATASTQPDGVVDSHQHLSQSAKQKLADKEFFTDLLSSAATKRDVKSYISRLKAGPTQKPSPPSPHLPVTATPISSLNKSAKLLGTVPRAVEASPVFQSDQDVQEGPIQEAEEDIHVALVKLSQLSKISDEQLHGIAQTLSLLSRLSITPCIVVDETAQAADEVAWRQQSNAQADRLLSALDTTRSRGGRRVNDILTLQDDGRTRLSLPRLILRPLLGGLMPVIVPVAYSESNQQAVRISANEAIIALTKGFAGPIGSASSHKSAEPQSLVSVDRIVVIDESGGIPSTRSVDKMHVFVNLEQEYHHMQEELRSSTDPQVSPQHASNLWMLRQALDLLPPTASGLITSPAEAANSRRPKHEEQVSSVRTRRRRNTLIHNLLTDKPALSSSLPRARLGSATASTFVKQGMPLVVLPNPAAQEWSAQKQPWIKLTDPRIDLDRLVYLINDSFDRKLDVDAYLNRVNERMAGVIIAGDYEGGAILTWETPPGVDPNDTSRLVPYLDKFAVLKKSQGAGGVADIVFNAMVRSCFPNGVCWRSRKNNPVNKWYFERSRGSFKIPGMNWTMFWTTPGVVDHDQTFRDYEAVCRSVVPTWADNKKLED